MSLTKGLASQLKLSGPPQASPLGKYCMHERMSTLTGGREQDEGQSSQKEPQIIIIGPCECIS
jgi:hypothetical protein